MLAWKESSVDYHGRPDRNPAEEAYTTEQPGWFSETRAVDELDAKDMLEAGEQPFNQVIADLNALGEGDIYKLVAPFVPAPLVDKASRLGISHWVTQGDGHESVIYFCRE